MKWIISLLVVLFSVNVMAETMVCKEWGYANNPEDFHSIKLEKHESTFVINQGQVIQTSINRVYEKVDPASFDMVNMGVEVYKQGLELLYVYYSEGKTNIGISNLVENSDTFFGDKSLYADCSAVAQKDRDYRPNNSQLLYATN